MGSKQQYIAASVALVVCSLAFSRTWFQIIAFAVCWSLIYKRKQVVRIWKTLPRDLRFVKDAAHFLALMRYYQFKNYTIIDLFHRQLEKQPDKKILKHLETSWTYQELEDYSNRVANYFQKQGIKRGDTVCLFMEGCPEYVAIWLGFCKLGAATALINTNLRQATLTHSINVVAGKHIIYGAELTDALKEIAGSVSDAKYYGLKGNRPDNHGRTLLEGSIPLDANLLEASKEPQPAAELKKTKITDKFLYIYTSGTTGMPKAAIMTYIRAMFMFHGPHILLHMSEDDVVYTPLPLYHTAGGILGICQALCMGCTVVIKTKFSVSNFWTDCAKYKCTVAQYIGEMCRYLLAGPVKPEETQHNVRLIVGNGLRAQIWEQFVKRFNIKQVGEFYGATESNCNIINADNTVGAVGFIPWFVKPIYSATLIRVDPDTSEPLRDERGLCIPCKEGEPGLLIGLINNRKAESAFHGYADKKASESKILQDVFAKGQSAFNSGDILICDELGYFYFKDRTGDTFRWRGENVATSEVEAVISNVIQLNDAVVYGVEINNVEGKAGMAAVVDPEKKVDLKQLAEGIKKSLPTYARPLFLRIMENVNLTATFKLKKTELVADGFNPAKISDPLYFADLKTGEFQPLTQQVYDDIQSGKIRL
nr:PREDICTED: long-chain fatty acid transport protein 1-like [Bemisia tabaci]